MLDIWGVSWSCSHILFVEWLNSKLSESHLSRVPNYSSWWPLTCLHFHLIGEFWILESITDSMSKWFYLVENEVYLSMAILMASIPSQADIVSPSLMLYFSHRLLKIMTFCRSPDSSLMYTSWYSGWPGVVLIADILWREYLWSSIMSTDVPHLSLK